MYMWMTEPLGEIREDNIMKPPLAIDCSFEAFSLMGAVKLSIPRSLVADKTDRRAEVNSNFVVRSPST